MKLSLRTKFIAVFFVFVAVTAISSIFVLYFQTREIMISEFLRKGTSLTKGLALSSRYAMLTEDSDSLRELAGTFKENQDVVFVVFKSPAGKALYSTDGTPEGVILSADALGKREEAIDPARDYLVFTSAVRLADVKLKGDTAGEGTAAGGEDGVRNREVIGRIYTGFSLENFRNNLSRAMAISAGLGAVVILFSLLLLFIFLRYVFKPLSILKTTVKKFAEGRLKERVWIPRKDEIGELAHAFNSMAEDLSKMHEGLEKLVDERTNDVVETRNATIFGLAHLAEYKDKETYRHLERMSEYAVVIAKELRKDSEYFSYIDERYIDNLFISAPLHDIGKVGIPDVILLKPGKLTPEEFEIMKQHTTLGGDLLKNMQTKLTKKNFLEMGKHVAYGHHERVDGKGYPRGLKTEETPVSARIVALADVYDALRSRRSYKEPFSHAKAVEIIRAGTGMQFDEKIVHAFLKCEDGILEVAARLGEEYS